MTKHDLHHLRKVISELKSKALQVGRYPPPYTDEHWENRKKDHGKLQYPPHPPSDLDPRYTTIPWQCIAYEELIRRIPALERIAAHLEQSGGDRATIVKENPGCDRCCICMQLCENKAAFTVEEITAQGDGAAQRGRVRWFVVCHKHLDELSRLLREERENARTSREGE